MRTYPYFMALVAPEATKHIAEYEVNLGAEQSQEIESFVVKATDSEANVYWVAQMPMEESNFQRLPQLQAAIGGYYGILREVVDGQIVRHYNNVDEYLATLGLTREIPSIPGIDT